MRTLLTGLLMALSACSDSEDPLAGLKNKCAEFVRRSIITQSVGPQCHQRRPVYETAALKAAQIEARQFFRTVRKANWRLNNHASRLITADFRPLPRDRKIDPASIGLIKGAALTNDWRFSVRLKRVAFSRPDNCEESKEEWSCSGWTIYGVRQDTGSRVVLGITGIPETFLEAHWWCQTVLSDKQDGCSATAYIDKFESPIICSTGPKFCLGNVKVMAIKVGLPNAANATAAIFERYMKLWRTP